MGFFYYASIARASFDGRWPPGSQWVFLQCCVLGIHERKKERNKQTKTRKGTEKPRIKRRTEQCHMSHQPLQCQFSVISASVIQIKRPERIWISRSDRNNVIITAHNSVITLLEAVDRKKTGVNLGLSCNNTIEQQLTVTHAVVKNHTAYCVREKKRRLKVSGQHM